jgi:hypothetical protein
MVGRFKYEKAIHLLSTIVATIAMLSPGFGRAATPTFVAITNVSVLDTVKEQLLPRQAVIIEGNTLQAVGAGPTRGVRHKREREDPSPGFDRRACAPSSTDRSNAPACASVITAEP